MSSLHPDLLVETTIGALASSSATDVYTVTDEETVILLSVIVTDPAGAVATACRVDIRRSSTNYGLAGSGLALPTATENLEAVGWPGIRLKRGDSVRLTGASGHHYFVTVRPIRGTGNRAQK